MANCANIFFLRIISLTEQAEGAKGKTIMRFAWWRQPCFQCREVVQSCISPAHGWMEAGRVAEEERRGAWDGSQRTSPPPPPSSIEARGLLWEEPSARWWQRKHFLIWVWSASAICSHHLYDHIWCVFPHWKCYNMWTGPDRWETQMDFELMAANAVAGECSVAKLWKQPDSMLENLLLPIISGWPSQSFCSLSCQVNYIWARGPALLRYLRLPNHLFTLPVKLSSQQFPHQKARQRAEAATNSKLEDKRQTYPLGKTIWSFTFE